MITKENALREILDRIQILEAKLKRVAELEGALEDIEELYSLSVELCEEWNSELFSLHSDVSDILDTADDEEFSELKEIETKILEENPYVETLEES